MLEVYPERVASLPQPLFEQIISSILFGIKHLDSEINLMSYTAIYSLGTERCCGSNMAFIDMLLGGIFHVLLYEFFDQELIENISRALFSLISWAPDRFRSVVETLIGIEKDPLIHQRLAAAFNTLLNGVNGVDVASKKKFTKNLESFVLTVRAFLKRI
jgi:hypothetical protein